MGIHRGNPPVSRIGPVFFGPDSTKERPRLGMTCLEKEKFSEDGLVQCRVTAVLVLPEIKYPHRSVAGRV